MTTLSNTARNHRLESPDIDIRQGKQRSGALAPTATAEPVDASRRRLLRAFAAAFGSAGAARLAAGGAALSTALAWAERDPQIAYTPAVFDADQFATLRSICDHVIPVTDTPGAVELRVHEFVDHQLAGAYGEEEREAARFALDAIGERAAEYRATSFARLPQDVQRGLLEDLEAERGGFDADEKRPFQRLKALVVFGYCTTEAGATRLLAWDPVPGGYRGSVPYASVGRAWFS